MRRFRYTVRLSDLTSRRSFRFPEKIDTFETSIQPFEDCCTIFVAKHPVTKPNLKVIRRSEEKLNEKIDQLMEEALATTEIIEIQ